MPLPFQVNAALLTLDLSGSRRAQIQRDLERLPNVCRSIATSQRIVNRYEAQARGNPTSTGTQAWRDMQTQIEAAGNAIGELYVALTDILVDAHTRGWITTAERDGLTATQPQGMGDIYSRAVPVIAITTGCAIALAGILLVLTAPFWVTALGVTAAIVTAAGIAVATLGTVVASSAIIDGLAETVLQFFRPVVVTGPDGKPVIKPSPFDQVKDALSSPIVLGVAALGVFLLLSNRSRGKAA